MGFWKWVGAAAIALVGALAAGGKASAKRTEERITIKNPDNSTWEFSKVVCAMTWKGLGIPFWKLAVAALIVGLVVSLCYQVWKWWNGPTDKPKKGGDDEKKEGK
ncbi:hypothetical protein PENSPDRAFT_651266 [Peniophora sp. CONT]|nr:hypothetical protein PENSPDRAFT_651266 [Peniophora sp. CONT]